MKRLMFLLTTAAAIAVVLPATDARSQDKTSKPLFVSGNGGYSLHANRKRDWAAQILPCTTSRNSADIRISRKSVPFRTPRQEQHPRPAYEKTTHMGYSVRTDRYRYTQWRSSETGELAANELYDHQHDAAEMVNLAGNRVAEPVGE